MFFCISFAKNAFFEHKCNNVWKTIPKEYTQIITIFWGKLLYPLWAKLVDFSPMQDH